MAILNSLPFRPRQILYLTDFSAVARDAFPHAVALARQYGATLHIAHAFDLGRYRWMVADGAAMLRDELLHSAQALLHNLDGPELRDVDHHIWLERMSPVRAAQELTAQFHIDLIVMGSEGRLGWEGLLAGSTAATIFRHAGAPAWVVGPRAGRRAPLQLPRILCPTDMVHYAAAQVAFSLAHSHQSALTLLHVVRPSWIGNPAPEVINETDTLTRELERLRLEVLPIDAGATAENVVVHGRDVSAAIVEEAQRRQASLIVMGAHEQGWWLPFGGGRLSNVIHSAPCPVLVVPNHSAALAPLHETATHAHYAQA